MTNDSPPSLIYWLMLPLLLPVYCIEYNGRFDYFYEDTTLDDSLAPMVDDGYGEPPSDNRGAIKCPGLF